MKTPVHALKIETLTHSDIDAMPRDDMHALGVRLMQAYARSCQDAQALDQQRLEESTTRPQPQPVIGATSYLELYRHAHSRMMNLDSAPSHNEARAHLSEGPHRFFEGPQRKLFS